MTPDYWPRAKAELSAADSVMAGIIAGYPGELLQTRGDAFYTLARSIVGQQVSVKAADSVWTKFEAYMLSSCGAQSASAGSGRHFSQDSVQSLCDSQNDEKLRNCGLSRQKIRYLGEIARYFIENDVNDAFFAQKTDEDVQKALTSIVGVGRWTAEMFLMFHLLRPNVFPVDDIGVQKAIVKQYASVTPSYDGMTKKEKIEWIKELAERWQPWRSVASWYLWRSLDPLPVAY